MTKADAGSTARAFMLPGRLRHPPVTSRPSVGQITHVFRARLRWWRSLSVFWTQLEFLKRNYCFYCFLFNLFLPTSSMNYLIPLTGAIFTKKKKKIISKSPKNTTDLVKFKLSFVIPLHVGTYSGTRCLTGPRCYINTDIQHYKPIHN